MINNVSLTVKQLLGRGGGERRGGEGKCYGGRDGEGNGKEEYEKGERANKKDEELKDGGRSSIIATAEERESWG